MEQAIYETPAYARGAADLQLPSASGDLVGPDTRLAHSRRKVLHFWVTENPTAR
jgi:hypothetical protein